MKMENSPINVLTRMVKSVTDKLEKATKSNDKEPKLYDKRRADALEGLGDVGQSSIDDHERQK